MNLGAFGVVALIRNEIFSEEIEDYAGLAQQAGYAVLPVPGRVPGQPGRHSSLRRVLREVGRLLVPVAGRLREQDHVGGARHRRRQHGLQLVLLRARAEGDVPDSAA